MVFGAPVSGSPAPQANKNQTMMFGTPASNAAAAQQQSAPPPSSKQTMVFGSGAAPVPPLNTPPQTPVSAKQTMMFGTPASNAAAASQPQAPAASPKATMVFGTGAAPPAPAKNQTMMFGTPASNAASAASGVGDETLLEMPGQSSRTVLFGQPAAQPPPPAAPAKNQTMMFGRPAAIPKISAGVADLAGMSANEGAPNEKTVRVDEAQVVAEHDEDPGSDLPQIPRHDRTQRFAMTDSGPSPVSASQSAAVQDRHNRTQLFAMSTAQERTLPVAEPPVEEPGADGGFDGGMESTVMVGDATTLPPGAMPTMDRASRMGGTDLNSTLPPDAMLEPTMLDSSQTDPRLMDPPGVSLLHDPANMTPPEPVQAAEGPVATTLPNLPVLKETPMRPLALELPPEPMGSPQDLRSPPVLQSQQQAAEDAAAMKAARSGGAGRAIVIILVIVALALAGVLVYRLFGKQLLGNLLGTAVPVEAIQQTEQALATLRFDDRASQEKAIAQLSGVLAEHPSLPETEAALVIAVALRFDDFQGQVARGNEALKALKANAGTEAQLAEVQAKVTASETAAKEQKAKLEEGLAKLQAMMPNSEAGSAAHLALLRADGLARGVLGDGEALTRAVAYKQRTEQRDDWVDLIEPEFALNGGTALDEAIAQLVALKSRGSNSTFLRPYVLLARLQLKKGESERAREELEQVATMNAQHEIAREMLASIAKP